MATVQLGPRSSYSEQALGGFGSYARRPPLFSAVRWGAVIAGVAVGVSVQLILSLLGVASGLSSTEVTQGETVGMGPLIWAGVSMLIAAFIGGYVAARMSGLKRKADGLLHGVVAWAVTTLLFATMATSAGGAALSGIFNNLSTAAGQTASSSGGAQSPLAMLRSQLGTNVDASTLQTLQQHIQAGRRNEAISMMTGSMGVDPARAATIVDQALIVSGSPQQASPQARSTAERAVKTAGTAAWTVFLGAALSLLFGIGGGVLGAAGARRVTWTDNSEAAANERTHEIPERTRS
jgi:hypothetical protein